MGWFRRSPKVELELNPDEMREIQDLLSRHDKPDVIDLVNTYPDSWSLQFASIPALLSQSSIERAHASAVRCNVLRPEDNRSKLASAIVYQVLSTAVLSDADDDIALTHQALGMTQPPSVGRDVHQAMNSLGLDIDETISEHRRLVLELLDLNISKGMRSQLTRSLKTNDMARDWRARSLTDNTRFSDS